MDVFFSATDGLSGEELWKSSGVEQTTVRVKSIVPGPAGSRPRLLTNNSGTLFFAALDISGSALGHLWKSGGTEAGTVAVTNQALLNFFSFVAPSIISMNGVVYFTAGPSGTNVELWKPSGTGGSRAGESQRHLSRRLQLGAWFPDHRQWRPFTSPQITVRMALNSGGLTALKRARRQWSRIQARTVFLECSRPVWPIRTHRCQWPAFLPGPS